MIKHPFENEQRNGHVVERMVLDQPNPPRIPPGCASPLLDVQTVAYFPCMPRSRKGKHTLKTTSREVRPTHVCCSISRAQYLSRLLGTYYQHRDVVLNRANKAKEDDGRSLSVSTLVTPILLGAMQAR